MRVGVLGLQGDVSEHMDVLRRLKANPVWVKDSATFKSVDALVIPGGESTTISELLQKNGLFDGVKRSGSNGMPIFGTCAGAILLAKDAGKQQRQTGQKLLGLMDMAVERNAFGRQRESFEAEVAVEGAGKIRAPFIRAPLITKVFGKCRPIAKLDGRIVAAEQGSLLAACFHPEISGDGRLHERFLLLVRRRTKVF